MAEANTAADVANSEFFYSNVRSVTTNFNVSPYYDDFDGTNEYYKILFKPGYAIQARELTQLQSILQEQINRFGQHVFKEGSMVLGGKFTLDNRAHYVKVNDFDLLDNPVKIADFKDQIVTGQTTGIKAYVNLVLDGTEGTDTPKTLYVTYMSGNPDTDEVVFAPNEPLISNVGTLVVGNTVPVGYGTVFTINEGIRFAKEHFIYHTKQSVVADRYDIRPTCKIGFVLEESIVDASQDATLLDPALESSNYAAPGADRFKITPILTRLDINDTAGFPDYVNLFTIDQGKVSEIDERPMYNVLRDEMAKRTSDESGDYYVRGFNTIIEEHLNIENNAGYLTFEKGGDSQVLSVQVEGGTAYVKGYEVNKLVTEFLTIPKSTAFANVNGQVITSRVGDYILVNEAVGAWNVNFGEEIDLYDTAQQRISRSISSTSPQTGKKIGAARVKSISHAEGKLGAPDGTIKVHLYDVNMLGSNSFSNVRSVYASSATNSDIGGDIVLTNGVTKLNEGYTPLLYFVGSNYTKTIRSPDGTVDTSFYFKKTTDVAIASDGTFSLTSTISNEIFPYGSGQLSSSDVIDIFLTVNSNVSFSVPGWTAVSGGGTSTLVGSGTSFMNLNVGDKILLSGNTRPYVVSSIIDNTNLTVLGTLPSSVSGAISKVYLAGDMIDLRGKAYTGASRTVTGASDSLNFNLNEPIETTGTVTYSMVRTNAREIRKVLKPKRYVLIDCATAGTTGPYNLGFSDVYRINSIRKASSFTTVDDGVDVSRDFAFHNGQYESWYENATVTPYSVMSASDKLLICLDYFLPDYTLGVGYFSVDSYPINDTNPGPDQITTSKIPIYISKDTNISYDLRNYFDFRPVFTNTSADATSLSGITTNPTVSTTLHGDAAGLRLPADSEPIIFDYSFYLARKDIVTLNKSGQFMIIQGVPASVPITPACPSHLMSISKLDIAPYPSLSPTYATMLSRADLACAVARTAQVRFTMKDIGVLKQRVDNLETYVSLSLLEKSALDMKILDENGLDRFKNGIFVDSFTSFNLSDVGNPDHHICYDPKEGSIRPLFETEAIGYDLYSSTNIVKMGNLLMLPFEEVVAIQQPYATTYRNVETTVYRFVGKLYLDPDSDYWVNTDRLASQTFHFGATDADVTPYSVVYGSWQTTVTGVTTSDPILLSSTSSSTSSITGTTDTGTKAYSLGPYASGVMPQYGGTKDRSFLQTLISQYGASTPITWNGTSVGGCGWAYCASLPAGYSLDATYGSIRTLGDLYNNWDQVASLSLFELSISGGTQTTTTITDTTNTYSTTTTTGTQASRAYTETFQTLKTETQSIGDKVTNVAPIADIRPQTIAFEARGVKASTRHFVYFDGQLMSDYVTPGKYNPPTGVTSINANTVASHIATNGAEGSSLYSDATGNLYGFLRIPSDASKSFRTGNKEVLVTDSPTNEPDATSAAKAYFVAQGITQTVQETIISTGQVITETKSGVEKLPIVYSNTTNTYTTFDQQVTSNTVTTSRAVITDLISCMAYSFKLNTPNGEEGTYLSSVDVFFAGKDPNLGVWFEIRAMDNAGGITKVQVPGSEVWLTTDEVNTSDDGSVATKVRFKAPVFLLNNQEYAFIIHTVGINPNYYMYVCVLGETDILTKKAVNSRLLTGTLFTTNNNTDWDQVPRTDLKVTFNRAKFNKNVAGEAILGNQQREYVQIPLSPVSGANCSWFGDRVLGNDELKLSTPTGTINTGDYLIGANSGANVPVSSISGSTYRMTNTGFESGEPITVRRANGYLTTVTSTVVTKNTPEAVIHKTVAKNDTRQFNGNSVVLILSSTNGLFKANDTLHMQFSSNTVAATSLTKFIYSTVQFEPSYVDYISTSIDFSMLATTNTGSPGTYQSIVPSNPIDYNDEKAIFSRTTELSNFGGAPSNRILVNMSTVSDYLTPVVNLDRTYTVYIHNKINSNTANELRASGGSLKDKYISQIVTLAEGQDAEDLQVILTAYRPPGSNSDIKVYARVSNGEDFESIKSKNWIEMEPFNRNIYCSLNNRKDWREFQYRFPASVMTGRNDQDLPIIEYTNSANTTFQGFKQYQIKIGLQSDTSAIFPRAADLRVIALQK